MNRTASYKNIHLPSVRPGNGMAGGRPQPSIDEEERCNLLANYLGQSIPSREDRLNPELLALYKFIDGEQLSRRDSVKLSQWLQSDRRQVNVELLVAMKKLVPTFIPTLYLGRDDEDLNLLLSVHERDLMTFGVAVTEELPQLIADALCKVMSSPQSRVTSFDYASLEISDKREACNIRGILRECITKCDTLELVSGFLPVLLLLKRGVREIKLYVPYGRPLKAPLLRVLGLKGVEKVSLKSNSFEAHLVLAEVVAEVNEKRLPECSIRHVELRCVRDVGSDCLDRILAPLFSAKHVTNLTLPNLRWLVSGWSAEEKQAWELILQKPQSLQSLTFDNMGNHVLDWAGPNGLSPKMALSQLDPILQRNRQTAQLTMRGVAEVFTQAAPESFFIDIDNEVQQKHLGSVIPPLVEHLMAFENTSTGRALAIVNKSTANRASDVRKEAESDYQSELKVLLESGALDARPWRAHSESSDRLMSATSLYQMRRKRQESSTLPPVRLDPILHLSEKPALAAMWKIASAFIKAVLRRDFTNEPLIEHLLAFANTNTGRALARVNRSTATAAHTATTQSSGGDTRPEPRDA